MLTASGIARSYGPRDLFKDVTPIIIDTWITSTSVCHFLFEVMKVQKRQLIVVL